MTPILNSHAVHDPQTRQTIVRLLSSMGSAKEISQYLKRFSQLDAARFAVVKVGGAVLRDDLDALVSSLAFLQDVGLTPIVIHGAGPQLDVELSAAGIEKKTINGLRVTSPEALAIVRRVFPVSYTHLDVYKRQGQRSKLRSTGRDSVSGASSALRVGVLSAEQAPLYESRNECDMLCLLYTSRCV